MIGCAQAANCPAGMRSWFKIIDRKLEEEKSPNLIRIACEVWLKMHEDMGPRIFLGDCIRQCFISSLTSRYELDWEQRQMLTAQMV